MMSDGSTMRSDSLARSWMALAGIVLVAVGLLGFVNNPLVGNGDALIPTGVVHNLVHLGTGLLALFIAFGLRGIQQTNGTIGFGVLYVGIFVLVLLSPTLFGLFEHAANFYLHAIHFALFTVSLVVGYMARSKLMGSANTSPERR